MKGAQRRTPVSSDGSCCSGKLDVIEERLVSAERTKKEIATLLKHAGGSSRSGKCKYNFSRLRDDLIYTHVWIIMVVALFTMRATHFYLASVRKLVMENARTPTQQMSRREVVTAAWKMT